MEPEKEKWINAVLGSLDGMQRSEPGPFVFAKIRNRLTDSPTSVYVPMRTVWIAVASFALLLMLNWRLAAGLFGPASSGAESGGLNSVISEMQLYPTNNQPYNAWSGPNY